MGREFERSLAGATALLAALVAALTGSAALAGNIDFSGDRDGGVLAAPCGSLGEGCARIRGYIKAGADVPARQGEAQLPLGAPPSAGRLGSAEDGLVPGMFSIGAGRGDSVR